MYLKKKGTVLLSTIVILLLMSTLGYFLFKMMKNNIELSNLYKFDKDIYDLSKNEEEILYDFMKDINKDIKENMKNSSINDSDNTDLFSEDFEKKINDSTLKYYKNDNKIFLFTKNSNNIVRKREITYFFKNENVVLIPTYKFRDSDE